MNDELIATYNDLMAKIDALRAEAKDKASAILQDGTREYFAKYGNLVEQIFWNQYTPWFNDGETCEFSAGDPMLVLVADDSEDKYSEGSYFAIDVEYIKENIAKWEKFNADPEAYKDTLGGNYFSSWYPREKYTPHYESLETLKEQLEQANSYPTGFVSATSVLMSFIASLDDKILEDLFDNHVTVRITASGIETEEYSHE